MATSRALARSGGEGSLAPQTAEAGPSASASSSGASSTASSSSLPTSLPSSPHQSPSPAFQAAAPAHDLYKNDPSAKISPARPAGKNGLPSWARMAIQNEHVGRMRKRQGASSGPVAEGYPSCDNVGNDELSCFPESNTTLVQDQWSKFIWNANYPSFIGNGAVDLYLFDAGSMRACVYWVQNFSNEPNAQGMVAVRPTEQWWNTSTASELPTGRNATYSYYFVIVPHGSTLSGGEVHQSTFAAIQTSPPSAVLASRSSSAASASSASAASASQSGSRSRSPTANSSPTDGSLQGGGGGGGDPFPKWAIAVITILGVLLLLVLLLLGFAYVRRRNRRNEVRETAFDGAAPADDPFGKRAEVADHEVNALLSPSTPMSEKGFVGGAPYRDSVAKTRPSDGTLGSSAVLGKSGKAKDTDSEPSPVSAAAGAYRGPSSPRPGSDGSSAMSVLERRRTGSVGPSGLREAVSHEPLKLNMPNSSQITGRSTGRSDSFHSAPDGGGSLSAIEAAAVADAFRTALRKPNFEKGAHQEAESPDTDSGATPKPKQSPSILTRELRDEGVGVKAVDERRQPEVHHSGHESDDEGR